jgi:NADPH:quinone reductase-like Zn-dependent oxidoreductase
VEKVGSDVIDLQPGDRVWVCADSRDVRCGAYQTFSIARRAHLGRIDEDVTDQEAATLGTGLITAAIVAYWFFNWNRALSLDGSKEIPTDSQMDYESVKGTDKWVL